MDVGMDSEQLEDDIELEGVPAAAEEAFEDDDILSTEEEEDEQGEEAADEEVDDDEEEDDEDDDDRPASRKRGASVDVSRLTRRQRTLYDTADAGADSSGAGPGGSGRGGSVPWHEMLLPKELDYSWKPKGGKLPSEMNEVEALKRQEALERRRQRALKDKREAEENIKAKLRKGLTAKFRKRGGRRGGGRGGRGAGAAAGGAGVDLGDGEGAHRGPARLAAGLMRVRCTAAGTHMCWGPRAHPSALPVAQQLRPPLPPLDFQLQLLPGGTEAATSPGAAAAGAAAGAAGGGGGADKERPMKPGARLLLVPAGVEWQQVRLQNRSQQHHHQQQQGKPPSGATPAGGKGASGTGMGKTIIKIKPRLKVRGTAEAGGAPAGTSPAASGSRVTPPEGHTANLACLSGDTLQVIGWLPPAAEQQLQQLLTTADVQGGPSPGAPAAAGTPPVSAAPPAAKGEGAPGGAATSTLGAAGWLRLWQQGVLQRLQLRVQAVQRPPPPQQQEQQQQMAPPCVALWQVQKHAAGMLELGASCGAATQQVERVWVRVRAGAPPVAVQ